jgi:hypothetical protein
MIIAAVVLVSRTWPAKPTGTAPRVGLPGLVSYKVGDTFEAIPGISFSAKQLTLVLYLHSQCRFCNASMVFYRGLVHGSTSQLVVIGFEPQAVLEGYLAEHRFKPDHVVSVAIGSVKFQGTPTLALIESNGKILEIWRGQLTTEREAEVKQRLQ